MNPKELDILMKNFSCKLLQQINQNKSKANQGFTLIELLVVIIIIGILSAIALPAFLNQANKARQSEAKQALGAINRGQQAYYLERQLFSDSIDGLGLGLQVSTENYSYGNAPTQAGMRSNVAMTIPGPGTTTGGGTGIEYETRGTANTPCTGPSGVGFGCSNTRSGFYGWTSFSAVYAIAANQEAVRDYLGVTMLVPGNSTNESTTIAALCEEANLDSPTLFQVNIDGGFNGLDSVIFDLQSTSEVNCGGTGTAPATIIVGQNAQNVNQ